ncbi:HNH endonuclease signature motif containing protein [Stutzerimonas stutzeri]|uniref:HNH endonuclease signature motif containing protein n=1 Tax=Stutzerimonas stutzeri TaxID=316 RepID=UPI00210D2B18|nr:HNH endonuclease signature motif containing protein [Stutzerimonas stutzeri]MCQ4257463.1 HNH endonuclease [Stutzerimonas stutzeri]
MRQGQSDKRRGSSTARGYGYRWQLAREDHLRRQPFCSMCSTNTRPVLALIVDHVIAPRLKEAKASGDAEQLARAWKLFWSRDNWQSLCKHCHDSVKQRLEKSGRLAGCDSTGRPLDPRHHWHRPG